MCSQMAYTYSVNRHASYPFSLFFTSLDGRTNDRLQSLGNASYKRWSNVHWYPDNYESLWLGDLDASTSSLKTETEILAANQPSTSTDGESAVIPRFPKSSFVYLTADTEDELQEIKADEIYIIGGICDHNRYKASKRAP